MKSPFSSTEKGVSTPQNRPAVRRQDNGQNASYWDGNAKRMRRTHSIISRLSSGQRQPLPRTPVARTIRGIWLRGKRNTMRSRLCEPRTRHEALLEPCVSFPRNQKFSWARLTSATFRGEMKIRQKPSDDPLARGWGRRTLLPCRSKVAWPS